MSLDAEVLWRARHGQYACLCCGSTEGITYVASMLCRECWLSLETQAKPMRGPEDVAAWLDKRRRKLEGKSNGAF